MLKVLKSSQVKLSEQSCCIGGTSERLEADVQHNQDSGLGPDANYDGIKSEHSMGDELQKSEIIRKAKEEAERIIVSAEQDAKQRADKIIANANELANIAIQEAQAEAEKRVGAIEEQARISGTQQGRQDAFEQYSDILPELISALEALIPTLENRQEKFFVEWEKNLRWLAIQVSRKALDRLVSEDELAMEDMIISAVDTVRDADWLDVEICSSSTALIDRLRTVLDGLDGVSVSPAMLPKDEAKISTSTGAIEVSVAKRLDNIEQYFRREGI